MSGNNINGDAPAGDRLPPPAFPRGRRRWRVPAPPPDANPPFEADLSPAEAAPQSLNDDVEVLPDEWAVREESHRDEVVTSEAAPAVRTQPPVLPEGFREDLADPEPETTEGWEDVAVEPVPEAVAGWDESEVEPVPETIDAADEVAAELTQAPEEVVGDWAAEPTEAAPAQDAGSEADPVSPLESAPMDPHVEAVTALVRRLADDLEALGETALAADAEVSPFEATLRAYCVGYLEGLRELESSDPDTP
jgi:hypothetical protein